MPYKPKKKKILSRALVCLLIILMVGMIMLLFDRIFPGLLTRVRNRDIQGVEDYLDAEGGWKGMLCLFLLSLIQVASIVLPGMPIQVAGGVLYGWLESSLICYAGFVFGNALVFLLRRRLRRRFRKHFPKNHELSEEEAMEYWLTEQMRKQNPAVAVGLAMLVPGIPNGIIPHAAARADITGRGFVAAVMVTSWLQIVTNCLCGHLLIRGELFWIAVVYVLHFLLIGLIAWKRQEILGRFR